MAVAATSSRLMVFLVIVCREGRHVFVSKRRCHPDCEMMELLRLRNQAKPRDQPLRCINLLQELGHRPHPGDVLTVALHWPVKHTRFEGCLNQACANNGVQPAFVVAQHCPWSQLGRAWNEKWHRMF